jgi:G:T-mismatch repair DNA endonuclease (very short patch repair protein)
VTSLHPAFAGGVFRGSEALRRGLLTPAQLRGPRWRRLRHDVYVDASVPLTHRLLAEAVTLTAPAGAVLGGLTAATLWSARGPFAGPEDPVEVVLPPDVRWNASSGVRVRTAPTTGDVVTDGILRWTDRTRTAVDLIRRAGPLDDAVVLLDRLSEHRVIFLDDVRAAVASLPRCRGSARARRIAALADGLAESPPETRLRLLLLRAGLPAPIAQFEVRHEGRFVARVDFGYPAHKLAIEYDGAWHGTAGQLTRDRARMNRLTAAGWRVIFVTAADMRRPEELAARIAAALSA